VRFHLDLRCEVGDGSHVEMAASILCLIASRQSDTDATVAGGLCVSAGSVPHQGSATPDLTLSDDANEILHELAAGLERIFLYVHQYSGDISTEQLPIVAKERRKINDFGAQSSFRRDSLIELTTR
jgi:hypothetical protein